jgi:hypothetical protein
MKLIKIILILTIISLAVATEFSRKSKTHKKSFSSAKAQTKTKGSGSWETGYNCPGIEISTNGSHFDGLTKVYFDPKSIESPSTDNSELGIYFKLITAEPKLNFPLNPFLGTVLRKDKRPGDRINSYYLPFRYITNNFYYLSSGMDFSQPCMQAWVTNDDKETFLFKINLPYKLIGYYITNEQANLTCQKINSIFPKRQMNITFMKSLIRTEGQRYFKLINQNRIESEKDKAKGQTKEVVDSNLKKKEEEFNQKQVELQDNQNTINEKEKELIPLQDKQKEYSTQITDLLEKLKTLKDSLNIAMADKEKAARTQDEIKADTEQAEKDINLKIENLLAAVPELDQKLKDEVKSKTKSSLVKNSLIIREYKLSLALGLIQP